MWFFISTFDPKYSSTMILAHSITYIHTHTRVFFLTFGCFLSCLTPAAMPRIAIIAIFVAVAITAGVVATQRLVVAFVLVFIVVVNFFYIATKQVSFRHQLVRVCVHESESAHTHSSTHFAFSDDKRHTDVHLTHVLKTWQAMNYENRRGMHTFTFTA